MDDRLLSDGPLDADLAYLEEAFDSWTTLPGCIAVPSCERAEQCVRLITARVTQCTGEDTMPPNEAPPDGPMTLAARTMSEIDGWRFSIDVSPTFAALGSAFISFGRAMIETFERYSVSLTAVAEQVRAVFWKDFDDLLAQCRRQRVGKMHHDYRRRLVSRRRRR